MTTTSQLGYLLMRPSLPVGMPDESGAPPCLHANRTKMACFSTSGHT